MFIYSEYCLAFPSVWLMSNLHIKIYKEQTLHVASDFPSTKIKQVKPQLNYTTGMAAVRFHTSVPKSISPHPSLWLAAPFDHQQGKLQQLIWWSLRSSDLTGGRPAVILRLEEPMGGLGQH